jgi:ATP phosphoribosyltransferase regulatory subunit
MPSWLLPENIADVLPSEARKIEELRRVILDQFRLYGYELVMPPMLEYIESLLSGTGRDMNLRTFKLVDQLSGRTMGLRADMTTQAARIDAHLLNRSSVTRLCYAGTVLHTRPSGFHATREPFQVGAEIYGHRGLEADAEIQELALASLQIAGIDFVRFDLCHVGVLRAIIEKDEAARKDEEELFLLMENKDVPGLRAMTADYQKITRNALMALPGLYGDVSVLERARTALPAYPAITEALDELKALVDLVGNAEVTVDLADLRGYHYHSGVMFAAYVPGVPNAVMRGGRYDHVGEIFGRARPATGFSLDLRVLAGLLPASPRKPAIGVEWNRCPELRAKIADLRRDGEIVIQQLPGHEHEQEEFDCDRTLALEDGHWIVRKLG